MNNKLSCFLVKGGWNLLWQSTVDNNASNKFFYNKINSDNYYCFQLVLIICFHILAKIWFKSTKQCYRVSLNETISLFIIAIIFWGQNKIDHFSIVTVWLLHTSPIMALFCKYFPAHCKIFGQNFFLCVTHHKGCFQFIYGLHYLKLLRIWEKNLFICRCL